MDSNNERTIQQLGSLHETLESSSRSINFSNQVLVNSEKNNRLTSELLRRARLFVTESRRHLRLF